MNKKKFVFEEVDVSKERDNNRKVPVYGSDKKELARSCLFWLYTLMITIVAMVVVGGATRLTDSGLSIVEWRPITGILLPITEISWLAEFNKYQAIPEFSLVNRDMTLSEFKYIYLWEWGHRQLGRAIGLIWLIGLATLIARKRIPPGWSVRFWIIGLLIFLQGSIGWWMVYSGLSNQMTDVASYRLAVHLGMAFIILFVILWYILLLSRDSESILLSRRQRDKKLSRLTIIFVGLLFLQILLGALVAGIDAGNSFNEWPLMAGELFPSDYLFYDSLLENFLYNPANVQFNHRMTAYLLCLSALLIFLESRKSPLPKIRQSYIVVIIVLVSQMILGVLTVLYGAPIILSIFHQLTGVILWLVTIYFCFETSFPRTKELR